LPVEDAKPVFPGFHTNSGESPLEFLILKGFFVQQNELFGDGFIQFLQAEKGTVPQPGQNLSLHMQDCVFCLGLIFGTIGQAGDITTQ